MYQFKGYYSRVVVEKSLISVPEFHLHLRKCLNVTAIYVFLPTPHCRRIYTVFSASYTFFKETDKKMNRLPNESTGNVSIKMCNSKCN